MVEELEFTIPIKVKFKGIRENFKSFDEDNEIESEFSKEEIENIFVDNLQFHIQEAIENDEDLIINYLSDLSYENMETYSELIDKTGLQVFIGDNEVGFSDVDDDDEE